MVPSSTWKYAASTQLHLHELVLPHLIASKCLLHTNNHQCIAECMGFKKWSRCGSVCSWVLGENIVPSRNWSLHANQTAVLVLHPWSYSWILCYPTLPYIGSWSWQCVMRVKVSTYWRNFQCPYSQVVQVDLGSVMRLVVKGLCGQPGHTSCWRWAEVKGRAICQPMLHVMNLTSLTCWNVKGKGNLSAHVACDESDITYKLES